MHSEFRAGERDVPVRLTCTECGGPASGENSWTNGSGHICDECVAKDRADSELPLADRQELRPHINAAIEATYEVFKSSVYCSNRALVNRARIELGKDATDQQVRAAVLGATEKLTDFGVSVIP